VRYADDFVILCNGSRDQVESVKEEIYYFLKDILKLDLSREKTKITHLNDGFIFLGFQVHRAIGADGGMKTKVLIPKKAVDNVISKITRLTDETTHQDSVSTKVLGLNRIIEGWCRYYQYTSKASTIFNKVDFQSFWKMAHWLGRKYAITTPTVLTRFGHNGAGLGMDGRLLVKSYQKFPTLHYKKRFLKPNPYTTQETIVREELPNKTHWTGWERRPGMADLRPLILARDQFTCQKCGHQVSPSEAHIDHKRPVRRFKRPMDANTEGNLQTLCIPCHKIKTEFDRQMESRMP